jgi:hypothetical protein
MIRAQKPKPPKQVMVTIRMTPEQRQQLNDEAWRSRSSVNTLCLQRLFQTEK